ncbi:hypothetical protein [Halomicrococcus sp. SG-WS-1]|uniref:hypothetical protein n=1 Tax=Halomicrococcus sp. SG-WS-1 TaxID=3439057 RepID=UPI003F792919
MQLSKYGVRRGLQAAAHSFWMGFAARAAPPYSESDPTYIYDRDWDGMIVLDACRVDALTAVSSEYDFLPAEIPSAYSAGSMSDEWLSKNFTQKYVDAIQNTACITANPYAGKFSHGNYEVTADDFDTFAHLVDQYFDEDRGVTPPRPLTDTAVSLLRDRTPDRFLVHYMQPHLPYRDLQIESDEDDSFRESAWDKIISGELSSDTAWEYYLDTLRWVLDDVKILLSNVDADEVILTADHGECYGEWGVYGHSPNSRIPVLREVPWVSLSATDEETHKPKKVADTVRDDEVGEESVDQTLRALGYKS